MKEILTLPAPRSADETREMDRKIREYLDPETDTKLRLRVGDMTFTLVRITDEADIQTFRPYCYGSPAGKYGVVWETPCLRDRYVFDTREYAVDFILLSCAIER